MLGVVVASVAGVVETPSALFAVWGLGFFVFFFGDFGDGDEFVAFLEGDHSYALGGPADFAEFAHAGADTMPLR